MADTVNEKTKIVFRRDPTGKIVKQRKLVCKPGFQPNADGTACEKIKYTGLNADGSKRLSKAELKLIMKKAIKKRKKGLKKALKKRAKTLKFKKQTGVEK